MVSNIAIAGAGIVGSYLGRLLQHGGINADIYSDDRGHGACGIHPCAWGASREFPDLVRRAGLEPKEYVFRDIDTINFEGRDLEAHLMTFDKPRLVRDLQAGLHIIKGPVPARRYERVIDSTGAARAYLPKTTDDLIVPCVQYRVRSEDRDNTKFIIRYGNIGYSWIFPLAGKEFHIGGGSVLENPIEMMREKGFLSVEDKVLCGCSGTIRCSSPSSSLPFVVDDSRLGCQVWGVGESIGAVGPIAGEGIVPGMTSANVLVANWDDSDRYTSRLLKEFSWMTGERRVINKVWKKERLSISDWIILRGTGKRMGSEVSLNDVRAILSCLNKYADTGDRADRRRSEPTTQEAIAYDQGGVRRCQDSSSTSMR